MNCKVTIAPSLARGKREFESNIREVRDARHTEDDLAVALYASLTRVLEQAPIENKIGVFSLMARSAAAEAIAFRQTQVDLLWHVAVGIGLPNLIGTATVQDALASAFSEGGS